MTKKSKIAYFFISSLFFVIFDLYITELILIRFKIPQNEVFDLIFVKNTGAAFSILENYSIFLILFSLLALISICVYAIKNIEKYSTIACFWASMLTAGIFCNLYERISFGYVRDFFKLNFVDFPIFNISDIFINIGVFAIVIIIILNKYIKK